MASNKENYVSIVVRAGTVMSIIVALAISSMMISVFVSENFSDDAIGINLAGSLRMQSIRVSRSLLVTNNSIIEAPNLDLSVEIDGFEKRLHSFESGPGHYLTKIDAATAETYLLIKSQWQLVRESISKESNSTSGTHNLIEELVSTIDHFVLELQNRSEKRLKLLRAIQYASAFLILLVSFLFMNRISGSVVQPLNRLVKAAHEAGKGNFQITSGQYANNEIGVLTETFNDMASRLEAMHDQLENQVHKKTRQLSNSNKSLQLLYQISHSLVTVESDRLYLSFLPRIEDVLSEGKLELHLNHEVAENTAVESQKYDGNDSIKLNTDESVEYRFKTIYNIEKDGAPFGRLTYQHNRDNGPKKWQHQLLKTIAENIAVSLKLEKKRRQDALLGLLNERGVIARELHDSLAQSLSYLKLQTGLLTKQLGTQAPSARIDETVTDIRQGISDAYRQLRELLNTFRLKLDDASLLSALKTTTEEFCRKCGHPIGLDVQIDTHILSSNEQIHILQIVREALSNVQRHAKANHASIRLWQASDIVNLVIKDDGLGYHPNAQRDTKHGITIITERADSLQASLSIVSAPGRGTSIELFFTPSLSQPPKQVEHEQHLNSISQEKAP